MIDFETAVLRLSLAVVFGVVVGVERQWRHKNAGIKTNTLVALGAAGFAMMSNIFGDGNHNPAQMAAAVVSGIGFIGAGVIIHRGATVQGVTTAATLWANASVGVAVGLGQYIVAAVLAAVIVIVQILIRPMGLLINRMSRQRWPARFELHVECAHAGLAHVNEQVNAWAEATKLTLVRRSIRRGTESIQWRGIYIAPNAAPLDVTEIEERLVASEGVRNVEVKHLGLEDDASAGL